MASKVYFVPTKDGVSKDERAQAALKIFQAASVSDKIEEGEYVAVKLHVGDQNNVTAIPPETIRPLVDEIKKKKGLPFLTETSTLYKGVRMNAVTHIMHAVSRGFTIENTGAPFIMADGLAGDSEKAVAIDGVLFKEVSVAKEARMSDFLLVISHMTGHMVAGFGATIKNLGMGLASRKGKLRQHSSMSPEVIPASCVMCGKCLQWCPVDAISKANDKALIDKDTCIGCGECLAVCRFGAIKYDWGADSKWMQEAMAEHALGVVKDKKAFYINDCCTMTQECDCMPTKQEVFIPDVGVLGSWDPVALDQASIDLTKHDGDINLSEKSYPNLDGNAQLIHAEKIKMGTRQYELITLE